MYRTAGLGDGKILTQGGRSLPPPFVSYPDSFSGAFVVVCDVFTVHGRRKVRTETLTNPGRTDMSPTPQPPLRVYLFRTRSNVQVEDGWHTGSTQ